MAGRDYVAVKDTPLITIEDEIDNSNPFCTTYKFGDSNVCFEQQNNELQGILQRQKEIQKDTVESIKRSKALLVESEVIGSKTAEELELQGEKLKVIEGKLDDTDASLQESEKNIRGIKSVFGGFKNYLSEKFGKSPSPEPEENSSPSGSSPSSPLLDTINTTKKKMGSPRANHPGFKARGFGHSPERQAAKNTDDIVDEGLEEISACLDTLKDLSIGFRNEIESQSVLIDRLTDKTSNTEETIKTQRKEISDILRN